MQFAQTRKVLTLVPVNLDLLGMESTAADKIEEPWRQTCCQRDPRKWHFQINREQTSIEQTLNLKNKQEMSKIQPIVGIDCSFK